MSAPETIVLQQQGNSTKMLYAMAGIGVLCALLIVLTFEGTRPRIERLRAEALQKAIFQVIPGAEGMQAFDWTGEAFTRIEEGSGRSPVLFAGYDQQNKLVGIAIEASGQGYADIIRILYGYDHKKHQVVGFHVLETKETPGLGDKIEKDPVFLANFQALDVTLNANGSALANAIVTVKSGTKENAWEIDGITGATISSRAIGAMLDESAQEWIPRIQQHLDDLRNE